MEDDLYDDVMTAQPAAKMAAVAVSVVPSNNHHSSDAPPLSLTEQVQKLQQRVHELERENENLQRNIGTLYRTAKAELQRKEDHIQQLMNESEGKHEGMDVNLKADLSHNVVDEKIKRWKVFYRVHW